MRKLAIAMAKGGVGKTSTAVNLAHNLALRGQRVLLVDCDTQSQVARFLGVKPKYGLYEFVTGVDSQGRAVSKSEAIYEARDNLWILSGGIGLVELKNWLGEQPRDVRHAVLLSHLTPREDSLDWLIFDCSPGWDILSVNILMAVKEVLCPVALESPSMEGLKTFFTYLVSVQKINKELRLKYILPTMYDRRTKHGENILKQLKRLFVREICNPIVRSIRVPEAASFGKSIFEYAPRTVSALDYHLLAERILGDGEK